MEVVGDVTLILDDNCLLELKDCLYVPDSRKTLILVSSLCKQNYLFVFLYNKQIFSNLNDSFICSRSLIDNL